jgi:hypothetical protein
MKQTSLVASLCLAACAPAPAPAPTEEPAAGDEVAAEEAWAVDGFLGLRVGMTLDEATEACRALGLATIDSDGHSTQCSTSFERPAFPPGLDLPREDEAFGSLEFRGDEAGRVDVLRLIGVFPEDAGASLEELTVRAIRRHGEPARRENDPACQDRLSPCLARGSRHLIEWPTARPASGPVKASLVLAAQTLNEGAVAEGQERGRLVFVLEIERDADGAPTPSE